MDSVQQNAQACHVSGHLFPSNKHSLHPSHRHNHNQNAIRTHGVCLISCCVVNCAPLRRAGQLSSPTPSHKSQRSISTIGLLLHHKNFGMWSYSNKRRIRWTEHVARVTEWNRHTKFYSENFKRWDRPLGWYSVDWRIILKQILYTEFI
jgi:hypothetical protein